MRLDSREESREEMALVAGSIVRGRRVKVSSMLEEVRVIRMNVACYGILLVSGLRMDG